MTGKCGCVAGLISSCKHVFAVLNYFENEVPLLVEGSAQAKSENRTYVFKEKVKKNHPTTKIENVSFVNSHPECGYDKI